MTTPPQSCGASRTAARARIFLRAIRSVASTRDGAQFLKGWAKFPIEYAAARAIGGLPHIGIDEIAPVGNTSISTASLWRDAGEWSLNLTERLMVSLVVTGRGATRIFEIGTFNGGTTRLLAQLVPDDGSVVTLDLPAAAFDATQHVLGFRGADVGRAFRGSEVEGKITQLRADSLSFDVSSYRSSFDVVLVDGAHDYEHGHADSLTALQLVTPGGIVLWDDFTPYWGGLVLGIVDAMAGKRLCRLSGTALGVHVAPG